MKTFEQFLKEKYLDDKFEPTFENIVKAEKEYVQASPVIKKALIPELINFKKWYDNLSPANKCTVHPPAGSGGSYGLYNMSDDDLIDSYMRFKKKSAKPEQQ
jgi:hypothetical protein